MAADNGPIDLKPSDSTPADTPRFATVEEAFTALEVPMLGYARRLLGDIDMAEDVVQEAFMRLHRQFWEVQDPRRWLYRTVHNLSLNQRRGAGRTQTLQPVASGRPADPAHDPADPQPLPDEQIIRLEQIGQVRLAIQLLDERSRGLLRLKFQEDLSYRQISERTGLGVGHVGYLLHHAVKKLAVELAKAGVRQ